MKDYLSSTEIELIELIRTIKYKIGDIVYHITDPNQNARVVIGYNIRSNNIMYTLSLNGNYDNSYEFEISYNKKY